MINITEELRRAFQALTSGEHDNFALFSCFVGNAPASAIVAVNPFRRLNSISHLLVEKVPIATDG